MAYTRVPRCLDNVEDMIATVTQSMLLEVELHRKQAFHTES